MIKLELFQGYGKIPHTNNSKQLWITYLESDFKKSVFEIYEGMKKIQTDINRHLSVYISAIPI